MDVKRTLALALLLFVVAALGTLGVKEYQRSRDRARASTSQAATPAHGRVVTVYYLHTTTRCPSCMKIESFTAAAVTGPRFSAPLAEGKMIFKVLNTDDAEHAHFVPEYELVTKSVVVSERVEGRETRWKRLDKVWDLLDDPTAFQKYIQEEVSAYLETPA